MLSLDGDPEMFFSYLILLQNCNFNKYKIRELEKYTVNLDHSLRHNIAFDRDLSFMKASDEKATESKDNDKDEEEQSEKKEKTFRSEEVKTTETAKTIDGGMEGKTGGWENKASSHLCFVDENPNYPYQRNAVSETHSA